LASLLPCLYVCSLLLPFVLPFGNTTTFTATCLLLPSAAALFVTGLLKLERRMQRLSVHTLWMPVTQSSEFSAGSAMAMLAVDVLLFAALTWWADEVSFTVNCKNSWKL
jgi:hypothetical protein